MVYWILFAILLTLSVIEIKHKPNKKLFCLCFSLLIVMTTLRQGQGSDYYNYDIIYSWVDDLSHQSFFLIFTATEPFFAILCYICNQIGMPFSVFTALVSAATMLLILPFFIRICKYSVFSLFLFYSIFYLIYFFSILRQGISLAIFASFALPEYYTNKRLRYVLLCIVCGMFHASAFILLIFAVLPVKIADKRWFIAIILIAIIVAIVNVNGIALPAFLKERVGVYEEKVTIFSILSRLFLVIPTLIIPRYLYEKDIGNIKKNALIIVMGLFVCCFFSFSFITASRIGAYFFITICQFGHTVMGQIKQNQLSGKKILTSSLLFLYCCINLPKDINGFIEQGEYQNCNVFTYPYITIFDTKKDVTLYRKNLGFKDTDFAL